MGWPAAARASGRRQTNTPDISLPSVFFHDDIVASKYFYVEKG
jgi:hypothetical protein